jgi:hypothetical protein
VEHGCEWSMDVSGRVVSGDQVYVDLDTIYDSICTINFVCENLYLQEKL